MSRRYIPAGALLHERYQIMEVIGEGGFGITYKAKDEVLDTTIVVKEYFPSEYASRNVEADEEMKLHIFQGSDAVAFQKGLERCRREARMMTMFRHEPGIVAVHDFFEENETAYIIMEYVDGITLSKYLYQVGRLSPEEVLKMMRELMKVVAKIHECGIIHRDISPDNIIMTKEGKPKLIDFGTSRYSNVESCQTMTVTLKRGYAPEEQYRTRGKQGSFTDVYALCATMYRMITGEVPPEATQRMVKDEIQWPTELGIPMLENQEKALKVGLAVMSEERFQTIEELYAALYSEKFPYVENNISEEPVKPKSNVATQQMSEVTRHSGAKDAPKESNVPVPALIVEEEGTQSKRKYPFILIGSGCVVIFILAGLFWWNGTFSEKNMLSVQLDTSTSTSAIASTTVTPAATPNATPEVKLTEVIPKVLKMNKKAALKQLSNKGFDTVAVKKKYSSKYETGLVAAQNPKAGIEAKLDKKVTLTISKGPKPTPAPTKVAPTRVPAPTPAPKATKKPVKKTEEPPLVLE